MRIRPSWAHFIGPWLLAGCAVGTNNNESTLGDDASTGSASTTGYQYDDDAAASDDGGLTAQNHGHHSSNGDASTGAGSSSGSSSGAGSSSGSSSGGSTSSGSGGSSGSASTSSSGSSGSSSGAGGSSSGSSGGGTTSSSGSSSSGGGSSSGGTSGVTFSVDMSKGPARQFNPPSSPVAVSPYVYGVNQFAAWESTTKWGVLRWGGDAFSSWNWTNNFSNAGSDFCFWQGAEAGGNGVATGVIGSTFPSVNTAQAAGMPSLVTVPILGSVSSSAVTNNVWQGSNPPCPGSPTCSSGSPNGYAANAGNLDFVSTDSSSTAFVANKASKGSTFCTCADSGCSGCSVSTTGTVYEDEFVNYLKVNYGSGGAPIFFSLDNEPNYWASSHPELWPHTGTPGCGTDGTVTFDDIVSRNTTFATAIKAAWSTAKVFGPVVAQDGMIYAHDYSDPNLPTTFTDYYLSKMASASVSAGKPLLDAYDVHYYTDNGTNAQCLQVPRMFWDPNFKDFSASDTDAIDFGWAGQNNYFDSSFYPRQMIPRLLGKISDAYSGKSTAAPGLSFSEYNAGCETVIEGGVAEADLLGIFGREGVYAATSWPLKPITNNGALANYLVAAYDLYRNYDGSGSAVGDTAAYAQTSDVEDTSVYAFAHSGSSADVELVAINKKSSALSVTIRIASAPSLTSATLYDLVGTKAGVVADSTHPSVSCSSGTCSLTVSLPATSATTIVLR